MKTKLPHYKSNEKLKIYSGAPVNKGFYDRNLNKAHKLYIKDKWQPPKPKIIKKTKNNTFIQKVDNYINDFKIIKQKFNLQEEEKEHKINVVEKYNEDIELEKIKMNNIFIDEMEKYYLPDFFDVTDNIINSIEE